ncbi:MAG TPA: hypothetical protein VFW87_02515 [Pirellulales bacterium]|nr:hypothetical protein [Pirellulales bacterium]
MPIHDWTRVEAGIFHHFQTEWMSMLAAALNQGLLPPDHYSLVEQIAGPWEPDVLTLKGPDTGLPERQPPVGTALAEWLFRFRVPRGGKSALRRPCKV